MCKDLKIKPQKSHLRDYISKSNCVSFSVLKFQRKFRPFFKFYSIRQFSFRMTSKITGDSYIVVLNDDNYVTISQVLSDYHYSFCITSLSDLAIKMLKHEII